MNINMTNGIKVKINGQTVTDFPSNVGGSNSNIKVKINGKPMKFSKGRGSYQQQWNSSTSNGKTRTKQRVYINGKRVYPKVSERPLEKTFRSSLLTLYRGSSIAVR